MSRRVSVAAIEKIASRFPTYSKLDGVGIPLEHRCANCVGKCGKGWDTNVKGEIKHFCSGECLELELTKNAVCRG